MLNLLNLSVPPNVLLPIPAVVVVVVVVVALPPVLVLGLFVFYCLCFSLWYALLFTANVEAVILPAVTSAIAVTITKIANSVVFLYT